jgi:hypothetical protein
VYRPSRIQRSPHINKYDSATALTQTITSISITSGTAHLEVIPIAWAFTDLRNSQAQQSRRSGIPLAVYFVRKSANVIAPIGQVSEVSKLARSKTCRLVDCLSAQIASGDGISSHVGFRYNLLPGTSHSFLVWMPCVRKLGVRRCES